MIRIKVQELDEHIKFLNEQAERLDALAKERSYRWASVHATQMRTISKLLLEFRRDQQMTTMSGKRIE